MQNIKIIPMEKYADKFPSIYPAKKYVPEWFRNSPAKISSQISEIHKDYRNATTATYKGCVPFFDAMTAGYMAVLTADIEVRPGENGKPNIFWRTKRNMVSHQEVEQLDGLPVPEGYSSFVYKFDNQFTIKTPKEFSLLFTHPSNRFDLPFITISGLVDSDEFDLPVNFPFFIKDSFSGIIEAGTPIAQIIPIKRESWKLENIPYSADRKHVLLEKYTSRIKKAYKYFYWKRKEYS